MELVIKGRITKIWYSATQPLYIVALHVIERVFLGP